MIMYASGRGEKKWNKGSLFIPPEVGGIANCVVAFSKFVAREWSNKVLGKSVPVPI